MFFNTHFNILAVDDEPDVLSLTKMLLRDVKVFGLPLNIETARSKAEAIEILDAYQAASAGGIQALISLVLIDVVMETDHAGLELCNYIRNTQKNFVTQLFIRTGQPGTAPERTVVDEYDINGYFTKTEMDEDKLYSIVKSGIRQANTVSNAVGVLRAADAIVENADSQESIYAVMNAITAAIGNSGGAITSDGELVDIDVITLMEDGTKLLGTAEHRGCRGALVRGVAKDARAPQRERGLLRDRRYHAGALHRALADHRRDPQRLPGTDGADPLADRHVPPVRAHDRIGVEAHRSTRLIDR